MPGQRYEFQEDDPNVQEPFEAKDVYYVTRKSAYEQGLEENDWVYEDVEVDFDDEEYDVEWEYWDNDQDNQLKPEYVKIDEGHEIINEDDKLLITTTGTSTYIPHMIGIKRMSKVRFKKDMAVTTLAQIEKERKAKEREARRRRRYHVEEIQENAPSMYRGQILKSPLKSFITLLFQMISQTGLTTKLSVTNLITWTI